jgi:hypothetical protein
VLLLRNRLSPGRPGSGGRLGTGGGPVQAVGLPAAPPLALGNPDSSDYGWILGQFALLGRADVVEALLDAGMAVDTRGWSNFTPLEQAAMNGRAEVVRLLIERGADDCAFDEEGPTPLDCAMWGCATPAPKTATTWGRDARWSRRVRRPGKARPPGMRGSMRCWRPGPVTGRRPNRGHPAVGAEHHRTGLAVRPP